jgi:hypothetical protein
MKKRRRDDALRNLSEADRAYRAAFRKLTSRGGRTGGSTRLSFEELVAATERLQAAARELLRHQDDTGHDDSGHPPPAG